MTFEEAIFKAVTTSHQVGLVVYIYRGKEDGVWSFSHERKDGWLFKAFPGGRRILSRNGKNLSAANLNE